MIICVISCIFLLHVKINIAFASLSGQSDASRPEYEYFLSTKTPYRFIQNPIDTEITYEGCNATGLWAVIRHGTRTPGTGFETLMRERLVEIRDAIVEANKIDDICNVSAFQKWVPHEELNGEKTLTHTGEDEMIELGERVGNRFPKLLPEEWYNSTYMFRFTDTSRTRASAKYFATGLFGKRIGNHVWFPEPMKKDPVLRFYKLCDRWRQQVKKHPETLLETEKFLATDMVKDMVQNVTNRLKLPEGYLSVDDVRSIYTACGFETAWDKYKKSPWCSLLTTNELKILEYAKDIEYYNIDGYGHTLTTKIACVMLKDAITKLKDTDDHEAVFYFTHSGTILKFLSHLGLYQDAKPIVHEDYHKNHNRLWRTSKIDAFASNIIIVRFDCADEPKLLIMHQERPVRLPGCPEDEDLCPLSRIEEIYSNSLTNCDFDKMCSTDKEVESAYRYLTDALFGLFK